MSQDHPSKSALASAPEAELWMLEALKLAHEAALRNEVPVGALVVRDGQIVGRGINLRETHCDATKHAEMDAIIEACKTLGTWRLTGCELYVTLEPCLMCAGAIYQARIDKVWFGAFDPKGGAMGSLYKVHEDDRLNHRLPAVGGILGEECGSILKEFFRKKRR
jgi:tRNA(adenine34) deaminase